MADKLNKDGVEAGSNLSFEELQRIESQRKLRNDAALKTHLSQAARRKRKKVSEPAE